MTQIARLCTLSACLLAPHLTKTTHSYTAGRQVFPSLRGHQLKAYYLLQGVMP